jgi:DNA-binding transcriptional LysR family regulator
MSIISKEVFTFVEVARWRSVRKAAERLNISASALSRQLRILEEDLGVQLLTRYSNGVETTQPGEQLLLKIQQLIALETELRGELVSTTNEQTLHIRLGLAESISRELVRRLRVHLSKMGESVRMDIVVGGTDQLVERLIEGRLDAVVAFNMPTHERFRDIEEFEVQVGLVCARGMITDPPETIALEDCLAWPLCLPGEELSIHSRLMTEISRQERAYRIAATSNSISTTCGLILDGAGVGFMTLPDVFAQPEAEDLHFIPLSDRRLTEHVSFAVASSLGFRGELGAALLPISKIASDIVTGLPGKKQK